MRNDFWNSCSIFPWTIRELRSKIDEVRNVFDDAKKQKQYEDSETELMKKWWDCDPDKRSKAEELYSSFDKWFRKIPS
jgi:hypothetical protein